MKRILSHDGSATKILHYSEHDNTAAIETVEDIAPLVNHVKQMKAANNNGYKSETMNYVGSVNTKLFLDWCAQKFISAEEALKDNKYLIMYLNARENSQFKAIDGKI